MRKYILILALAMPLNAAAQYTIIDLGTLGGNYSSGLGLSSSGRVAGFSYLPSGDFHAFLWRDGEMIDLGTLFNDPGSVAFGVNVLDRVVGNSTSWGGEFPLAFLWVDGEMTALGTFGGSSSSAYSINDSDQIAGWAYTGFEVSRAFLWEGGTMTDLGTLPGGEIAGAIGINSLRQVVGTSGVGNNVFRPFLWENGAMTDLGSFGGDRGTAWAINDSAQAVGYSEISPGGSEHAFLWSGGVMTDLGTLLGGESQASDINAAGDVVGRSDGRAFLWSSGSMTDLNDLLLPGSGWELLSATGINDAGQIAGRGVIDGRNHAYRMTPVPEPGTFAVLSVALIALARRRRR